MACVGDTADLAGGLFQKTEDVPDGLAAELLAEVDAVVHGVMAVSRAMRRTGAAGQDTHTAPAAATGTRDAHGPGTAGGGPRRMQGAPMASGGNQLEYDSEVETDAQAMEEDSPVGQEETPTGLPPKKGKGRLRTGRAREALLVPGVPGRHRQHRRDHTCHLGSIDAWAGRCEGTMDPSASDGAGEKSTYSSNRATRFGPDVLGLPTCWEKLCAAKV